MTPKVTRPGPDATSRDYYSRPRSESTRFEVTSPRSVAAPGVADRQSGSSFQSWRKHSSEALAQLISGVLIRQERADAPQRGAAGVVSFD